MTAPPSESNLSRRNALKLGAAALGTAALAGCGAPGGEVSETPSLPERTEGPGPRTERPRAEQYGTVTNVVDAGADPTGSEPIGSELQEHLNDDTLLSFPDGVYRLSNQTFRGLRNAALVAEPGARPVLTPARPADEAGPYFLSFLDVREFVLDGLTFDFRQEGYGGRVQVIGSGDFVARNLTTVGRYPADAIAFRFDVRNEAGTGLVENLVATSVPQTNESVTGMYVGHQHSGELTFRDCEVAGFSDNGLYASAPGGAGGAIPDAMDGPVHVRGGSYRNNNVAGVRLGSTGSTARDVEIVVDRVPPHRNDSVNARGLRLRGQQGQVVENCRITIGPEAGTGFGAIVFHRDSGQATVRNTTVRVDRDGVPAIYAIEPSSGPGGGPTFRNVDIRGSASGGATARLEGRNGTEFRNCSIRQRGSNRSGIELVDSRNCLVADTSIDVSGRPLVTTRSTVRKRNVSIDGGGSGLG
ncbi:right-handed parallel beta-helix repeat-containing protein [Halogeometricum luteum]|uniref:Right-handed parallel beta-helix repeat-containing protein n=1 Tax=Halogeometricum luteum TaxID=2950537 RepID=A0ABU2G4L1_9EURY|nr:right-handed parallel beta-helix repeat-containing protein [Halogeometricum sp. S3BR5-2]MDS0295234.1 right-handed parallel beta-helix repeat-containing protein [Halogeometricum sp. S3BR5-2]